MTMPDDRQPHPSLPSLRDLSHDLRTPMAVIRMQAQYLLRMSNQCATLPLAERERLTAGLHRIDDAVTTLSRVLEQFDDRVAPELAARQEAADLH